MIRPRRLTPPTAPGAMLKRFDAPSVRPRKTDDDRDPDYLAQVRQMPCLKCVCEPCGEAAHVRIASATFGKASGMGKTPPDRWAVPLCASCHRLARDAQHTKGEALFWAGTGINVLIVCVQLYAQRGNLAAMRLTVLLAAATRRASP
ncbi:MAG: hypothetical protein PS018_17325 [bacterium]|nr:hypothetical protein [bacterium]